MRILHLEPHRYDKDLRGKLEQVGQVDYVAGETWTDQLPHSDYAAAFVRLGIAVDQSFLARFPGLRWVVTPTTGLDHIDTKALHQHQIRLISLKGEVELLKQVRSTAEHTWGLLLALLRHVPQAFSSVKAGEWTREPFLGDECGGKVLGIWGLGRLGQMVAQYGEAFGMKVIACDTAPEAFCDSPAESVDHGELLARADILSLHLPLNSDTRNILGSAELAGMSRGAFVVNTARGELVDEAALAKSIQAGHIAGYATDVLADDGSWEGSVPAKHPLHLLAQQGARILITPHIGGYGYESIRRTRAFVTDQFVQQARTDQP